MFQQPAAKNADGKTVTRGKDMELRKVSYRERGPRESVCSGGLLTLGISAHVCPMMLGIKTAVIFSQRQNCKTSKGKHCIFCLCDEMILIHILVQNVIFWPETLHNSICSGSWLSHQLKSVWKFLLYPTGCSPWEDIWLKDCLRLLPFGQCRYLLTGSKSTLVSDKQPINAISLKSFVEKTQWNPERKQQYSCQHLEWKLCEWTLSVFQGLSHWNCKTHFETKCLCQKHTTYFL